MNRFYQKGIMIEELIFVLAIIVVLVLIVSPQFSKMRENQVLKNGVENVLTAFHIAQSQSIASLDSSEYGLHFQSDKIIIFKGKIFSSGATDNKTMDITSPATISNISLTGGVSDLYFEKLKGVPNVSGSITISGSNLSKTITISNMGAISVN